MNFDRLRFVAERAEVGEQREALFAVTIPEQPGSFRRFCALLGARNVTEFNYRYRRRARGARVRRRRGRAAATRPARSSRSFARARLRDARPDRQRAGQAARAPHGRRPRAAGARRAASTASSFPERPGALMRFLDSMQPRLEHQPVPLPQPRRRLRPRAGRHAGAARTRRGVPRVPRHARLSVRRRDAQPGLPAVPRSDL